jgi:hypothetical protein
MAKQRIQVGGRGVYHACFRLYSLVNEERSPTGIPILEENPFKKMPKSRLRVIYG